MNNPQVFFFHGPDRTTSAAVGCTIARAAVGHYVITIDPPFANANFEVHLSSSQPRFTTQRVNASTVNVLTYDAEGVAADAVIIGRAWADHGNA